MSYAYSAARALLDHTEMDARAIVEAAMRITASICIYTNDNLVVETIGGEDSEQANGRAGEETTEASSEDGEATEDTTG